MSGPIDNRPPLLEDMPIVVMNKILETVTIRGIQSLRKTCTAFRNFIDYYKPDSKLLKINLHLNPSTIEVNYYRKDEDVTVLYRKTRKGCIVGNRKQDMKLVTTQDMHGVFLEDLKLIMINQKSSLKAMDVRTYKLEERESQRLLPAIGALLTNNGPPLNLRQAHIRVNNESQALALLPYVNVHNKLRLMIGHTDGAFFEMNQIAALPHWTQTEMHIRIIVPRIESIPRLLEMEKVVFTVESLSFDEMHLLRQNFVRTTTLKLVLIYPRSFDEIIRFCDSLGTPNLIRFERKPTGEHLSWAFRIPDSEKVLNVLMNDMFICYSRETLKSIPRGTTIQEL